MLCAEDAFLSVFLLRVRSSKIVGLTRVKGSLVPIQPIECRVSIGNNTNPVSPLGPEAGSGAVSAGQPEQPSENRT